MARVNSPGSQEKGLRLKAADVSREITTAFQKGTTINMAMIVRTITEKISVPCHLCLFLIFGFFILSVSFPVFA